MAAGNGGTSGGRPAPAAEGLHAAVSLLDAALAILTQEKHNPCQTYDRAVLGTCVGRQSTDRLWEWDPDKMCHACAAFLLTTRAVHRARQAKAVR